MLFREAELARAREQLEELSSSKEALADAETRAPGMRHTTHVCCPFWRGRVLLKGGQKETYIVWQRLPPVLRHVLRWAHHSATNWTWLPLKMPMAVLR